IFIYAYSVHRTNEKSEGVHKANGTNGNEATGCILYQTRVLLHIRTSVLIQCWRFYFAHGSRQKVLVARLSGGFLVFCRL
ncbi:MAG: hypothetical protein PHV32_15885, partial [Eubacteriales bacterium]|nr:hypothetical protein [Eubacteriales bacterium]